MPAVATPEAPAQTPALSEQASAAAQKAAQTTINVSSMPSSTEPSKPPKPGTARARLSEAFHKKFSGEETTTPEPPKESPPPAPTPTKAEDDTTEAHPTGSESTTSEPVPPSTAQPKRATSPWKLVDQFKERAAKAEARILELEKLAPSADQVKASQEKLATLEKQIAEMTEELRFVHAEKYDPDVKQAKDAYERAMRRAMGELKDVTVNDPATQQPRALTMEDIAELAFLPLGQAQQVAKEVFGELAPYVMDHRNEVRRLWDEQQAKISELKTTGASREKSRAEAQQKAMSEMSEFVKTTYQKVNEEAAADENHGHFFRQRDPKSDADKAWNERLEKGYKLVDDAYASTPLDPKLTPAQREDIIRRHAAVRNRAASWGALRHENDNLRKQMAELEKELKAYKESQPSTSGRSSSTSESKLSGMAALRAELHKLAH